MRTLRSAVLAGAVTVAAPVLSGCTLHLHSPPARTLPLETARVLEDGKYAVQLSAADHGLDFDNNAISGTATVRRGFGDGWEGSVEASAIKANPEKATAVELSPWAGSGRIGVKRRLVGDALAAEVGLGGGGYVGGGYFSPDVALITSYENPYVVPFLSVRAGVSQPIGPREVDLSLAGDGEGVHLSTPITTGFYGFNLGLRVPIGPMALVAGAQFQRLVDSETDRNVFSLGGAVEASF